MPNTHTWSIDDLQRKTSSGGVYDIDVRVVCSDGTNSIEEVFKVGVTPNPSDPNYTPYDDLTEAQVLGWVYGIVDQTEIENGLDDALAQKIADASGKPW